MGGHAVQVMPWSSGAGACPSPWTLRRAMSHAAAQKRSLQRTWHRTRMGQAAIMSLSMRESASKQASSSIGTQLPFSCETVSCRI